MTQVILLAAGKSTRTWPIEEKIFVSLCGKTLLEWQIETIFSANITHLCIVANTENKDMIQLLCQKYPNPISVVLQENLQEGIRGGILSAQKCIDQKKPVLVVCSNDIVEKSAFIEILHRAEKSPSDIFLLGKKVEKYFPGGYLELSGGKNTNNSSRIINIVEKPKPGEEPSDMVTLLIHFFRSPAVLFSKLQKKGSGDGYEEVLQSLFFKKKGAEVVVYNGFWQAIKYPWHFLLVRSFFLQKAQKSIHPGSKVAASAIVGSEVVIEEGVCVHEGAVVIGPCFLGKGSQIFQNTLVRESIIEEGGVVGFGTEVVRSILQKSCWLHQNFVGDSFLGENTSFGAGTRTANLRLEEGDIFSEIREEKTNSYQKKMGVISGKNIRVGVNTSFMPGVKIGKNSFIGAGVVITKDVSENRFITEKKELQERENIKIISQKRYF